MEAQEIFNKLSSQFGEQIIELREEETLNPTVVVNPAALNSICSFLHADESLLFDALMNLAGHDPGPEAEFEVIYHLYSTSHDHYITLKVSTPRETPAVSSVAELYRTADWHEREAYDMFGIQFDGHPDLKRILLEEDWEGYPLRKDYVPAEFYRGMRIEKVK